MIEKSPKSDNFLAPIRVLELGSRAGVGALGGLLAQLGADTIVVEPTQPLKLNKWRNRPVMMAGKRSIVIDQNSTEGAKELKRLIAAADVVLISSDVDTKHYAIWKSARPRHSIVCDMTAYGHSGPLAEMAASDGLAQAMSGVVDTTGPLDLAPTAVGFPVLEMHAAVLAATAIIAALRVVRRDGAGQRIDVALFDVGVTALINFVPLRLAEKYSSRCGNRHPLYAPWGTYRAKDGWILICAPMNDHWTRVCEAMGRPELATDERFATMAGRLDNFRTIDHIVNEWTATLSVNECERILMKPGISCGPIIDVAGLDQQPNIVHRRTVQNVIDPESGSSIKIPASPLHGSLAREEAEVFVPARDADRRGVLALAPKTPEKFIEGDEVLAKGAYDGIRIIEVGQYTVAPMASRILGAMGADVIKVEAPIGDAVRKAAPLRADGGSYIFAMSNTDKRGVVLDLRNEGDQEKLHKMLEGADALIENLKPGSLAKFGFGSDNLRGRHPNLVFCSVNGFGMDSIYPGRPALDTVVQAMSGIMSLTEVGGVPMKAGISVSDNLGGQFSLLSLAAGIELRERTGTVAHFDLSMQDTSAWATQMAWNGSQPSDETAIVPSSDGGFVAVAGKKDEVAAFLKAEKISSDKKSREHLIEIISTKFDCAPVLSVGEAMAHPQTASRNLLLNRSTAEGDEWLVFSTPFKLLSTPAEVKSVISPLGVGADAVFRSLGIASEKRAVESIA